MSLLNNSDGHITEEEYLQGELLTDIRHEYIDGQIYAMAGASTKHNLISKNVLFGLEQSLRKQNSPCDVFSSDMKVKIRDKITNYFYPDVMLVCEKNTDNDYFQNSPLIIFEVISDTTRKTDLVTKKLYYFNLPSLQEYVVIEQDIYQVIVFRKDEGWKSSFYFPGDEIKFDSINITLSVEDMYYHVHNSEISS